MGSCLNNLVFVVWISTCKKLIEVEIYLVYIGQL